MKRIFGFVVLTFLLNSAFGQDRNHELAAIKQTINSMFDGMRRGDSSAVRHTFAPNMVLQSIVTRNNHTEVRTESPAGFLRAVGTPHEKIWDEQITFDAIQLDANLASVWTSYKFYLGKDFSHCGVNSFQLVKIDGVWKITHLIDTRRKSDCN